MTDHATEVHGSVGVALIVEVLILGTFITCGFDSAADTVADAITEAECAENQEGGGVPR